MLKKLQKHIKDICFSGRSVGGVFDGIHYIATDHIVVYFDEDIPDIPKMGAMSDSMKKTVIDKIMDTREVDWIRHELPPVKEIKGQVTDLVGKKRVPKVNWSDDGTWAINARYLVPAMEALNAKGCYIPKGSQSLYYPVKLFQNDDVTSSVCEGIMQIRNDDGRKGVWLDSNDER